MGGQTLVRGLWSCTLCNRDINGNWSLRLHVKVGMFLGKREGAFSFLNAQETEDVAEMSIEF